MMCDKCIHRDVCGADYDDALTYCGFKVQIDDIISKIEQARDKDQIAEYPYNRCIKIIREVLGDD